MPFTPWRGEQQPDVLLSPAFPQGHKAGQVPQGPDKATIIRKATDKGLEPWNFSEERDGKRWRAKRWLSLHTDSVLRTLCLLSQFTDVGGSFYF